MPVSLKSRGEGGKKVMVRVTINEQTLEVETGSTVLQAAERLGIDIPTFCYLKRLPALASCRMCLVEIEGQRRLQPSCATAVTDGMVVRTNTPLIDETRSSMLDMLLANHPLDCPICDKGGECELQDMVMAYGPRESRFRDAKRVFHSEDIRLSPVIIMNVNRCIQCQRCVRMCEEVVGAVALGTVEKGMDTAVTGFEGSLASCDQCGNCVEVCPVGALMSFPYRYKARPWDLAETDTVCPHCGTGCQLTVGTRKGEFMRVRSKAEHGVNRETLCVRGRFGLDFVASQDRIKRPMVRRDGTLVPVSWEEAGDYLQTAPVGRRGKACGRAGLAAPSQRDALSVPENDADGIPDEQHRLRVALVHAFRCARPTGGGFLHPRAAGGSDRQRLRACHRRQRDRRKPGHRIPAAGWRSAAAVRVAHALGAAIPPGRRRPGSCSRFARR